MWPDRVSNPGRLALESDDLLKCASAAVNSQTYISIPISRGQMFKASLA